MRARIRGHKYGAVRTEVDGYSFASKAEARRYSELKLLEKAGEIARLELQPKFELHVASFIRNCPPGVRHPRKVCTYIADFSYIDRSGKAVYEDTKGFRTPVYRLKKKMVEAQYGITITEIGRATNATKAKRAQSTRRSASAKVKHVLKSEVMQEKRS